MTKCQNCENCPKEENLIDQFITDGEFDKAFNEVFGLPESVVESLGEA